MNDNPDVFCLSHLRWDFVFQRPNHLMTRCARDRRVFFVEEPLHHEGAPELSVAETSHGVTVVTPRLPHGLERDEAESLQRRMLRGFACERGARNPIAWFYTPMALPLADDLAPSLVVYDCMDELSAFAGAPPLLRERERELLARAHLVFTGGQSLYEAKRAHHPAVHAFASSVDAGHFASALHADVEPLDQQSIPWPRLGFFGVIDERMDLDLVAHLAESRPQYHLVMVGPVVKIDPDKLPRRANIHWLGARRYDELPGYLAGWDVAIMPFALNDATRFISPTKTLEYLAAGRPVVSTAIRDVVHPYGDWGVVSIADRETFTGAVDRALATDLAAHRRVAAGVVGATSWDATWDAMARLLAEAARSAPRDADSTHGGPACSTI